MLLSSEKRITPESTSYSKKVEENNPTKMRQKARSSHRKYKKFQKFLQGNCSTADPNKNASVFYHFPLL